MGNPLITGVKFMYDGERPKGIGYMNLVNRRLANAFCEKWHGKRLDGYHRLEVVLSEVLMRETDKRGGNTYGKMRTDEQVWECPEPLPRQTEH